MAGWAASSISCADETSATNVHEKLTAEENPSQLNLVNEYRKYPRVYTMLL